MCCQHSICATCRLRIENGANGEEGACPKCAESLTTRTNSRLPHSAATFVAPSAKVEALLKNLHAEQTVETRSHSSRPVKRCVIPTLSKSYDCQSLTFLSVVFSYWTKMLDLIQQALQSHGFSFQRIDGKTDLEKRSEAIRQFNEDPTCTIMLASIGSAGEG
jgi:SNF2 family DNA or RNA helicase